MIKEIERKFLVKNLPSEYQLHKHSEIVQGYISIDGDGTEVRLRKMDNSYTITVKTGKGLVREEYQILIPQEHFQILWSTTSGRRIKKTRYFINHHGFILQLDIYSGHLKGLITAEVEFSSIEESEKFTPPDWIGEDVTNDIRYKNKNLAIYGINF